MLSNSSNRVHPRAGQGSLASSKATQALCLKLRRLSSKGSIRCRCTSSSSSNSRTQWVGFKDKMVAQAEVLVDQEDRLSRLDREDQD